MRYSYTTKLVEETDASQTISLRTLNDGEIDDFAEGIYDALFEGGIVGVLVNFGTGIAINESIGALTKILAEKAAVRGGLGVSARLLPGAGLVITGAMALVTVAVNAPLYEACNKDPEILIENKHTAYYCGKLVANTVALTLGVVGPGAVKGVKGALNKLGVFSKAAQKGKMVIVSSIPDSPEGRRALALIKEKTESDIGLREDFNKTPEEIHATVDDIQNVIHNEPKLRRALNSRFGLKRVILVGELEPKLPQGYKELWEGIHDKISAALIKRKGIDDTFSSYSTLKAAYWKEFGKLPEVEGFKFTPAELKKISEGGSPEILINGEKERIVLHHLLPQKVSKIDVINLENIFPIPQSAHVWTHSKVGSTYARFGPLQNYQEPDLNDQ